MADVDMKSWVRAFESQMKAEFGSRVCFLGLQGSRARGEAHAGSDIDAVAILDKMSLDELARYRAVLERLPHRELACGFISGKEELCWWEPSELLQFYFDTVPVCGTLDFLRPALTPQAAQHAVLSGACSIYHACAHNYVHARSGEALRGLCKPGAVCAARPALLRNRCVSAHRARAGGCAGGAGGLCVARHAGICCGHSGL